jgi:hypothetical protein
VKKLALILAVTALALGACGDRTDPNEVARLAAQYQNCLVQKQSRADFTGEVAYYSDLYPSAAALCDYLVYGKPAKTRPLACGLPTITLPAGC